ncbi:MAG: NAD(P)H-hydrate epimerase, partial [Candidatus Hydrothermota bacterium]
MAIKVVTPEEMSGIDRKTIEDFGIPSFTLMESAGRSVYSFIRSLFEDDLKFLNVAVVVGKGNNGGDGLVVARYLMDKVSNVDIFLLSEAAAFKGDARKNFELVEKMGINLVEVDVLPSLEEYDLIVDAIFGTGFRGQPDDRLLKCFEKINLSGTL